MMKLDNRGTASWEFCLVAVAFFTVVFAIFDLGRYAITMQSLRALADAGARTMMINCYTPQIIANKSPSSCTSDPLPSASAKRAIAPFLYAGGLSPSLSVAATSSGGSSALTVTASESKFSMLMPIWGTALNNPTASTSVPY